MQALRYLTALLVGFILCVGALHLRLAIEERNAIRVHTHALEAPANPQLRIYHLPGEDLGCQRAEARRTEHFSCL